MSDASGSPWAIDVAREAVESEAGPDLSDEELDDWVDDNVERVRSVALDIIKRRELHTGHLRLEAADFAADPSQH